MKPFLPAMEGVFHRGDAAVSGLVLIVPFSIVTVIGTRDCGKKARPGGSPTHNERVLPL